MSKGWSLRIKFVCISVAFTLPSLLQLIFLHFRTREVSHDTAYYQVLGLVVLAWLGCSGIALFLLQRIIHNLRAIAEQLKIVTHETLGSSQKLDVSSKKSAAAAQQEAAAIQESVTAMTEMTSMLGQTGQHTRSTKEVAEQSLGRAQDGALTMQKLAQSMQRIAEAHLHLREISTIIDSIATRTTVINDIVFKTQLLSVNASIEAARAGHHGKGFAVVAGEVASLANLSGKAAEEIRELLKKSRHEVAEILASTRESIDSGQEVVRDALESFEAITTAMNQINDKVQQIFEATREQEMGVQQTSDALGELSRTTSEHSGIAYHQTQLSDHLKQQGFQLKRIERAMSFVISGQDSESRTLTPWSNINDSVLPSPIEEKAERQTLSDRIEIEDPQDLKGVILSSDRKNHGSSTQGPGVPGTRKADLAARIIKKASGQGDDALPKNHMSTTEVMNNSRFAWQESYDIGIERMNDEHQILLGIMDKLEKAVDQDQPHAEQRRLLQELKRFTEQHFSSEEKYLESISYPDLKQHHLIHDNLLERLDAYTKSFEREGYLGEDFFQFLLTWLAAHIMGVDVKYARFVQDHRSVA
jgi:hemerythrin-like metal-binding protein